MFCGSIETYLDFLTHQAGRRSRSGLLAKKYVKGPTSARGKVVKVPRQREEKMYKGTSRLFVHSTRDTHLTSEAKGNLAEKRKQVQTSHALKSLNECPPVDLNLRSLQQPFCTPSPVIQTQHSTFEPSFEDQQPSYYDNYYPQSTSHYQNGDNPTSSSSTSHYQNGDNPTSSSSTSHYQNGDNPTSSSSTSHYQNGANPTSSSSTSHYHGNHHPPFHKPNHSDLRHCHASLPSPVPFNRPNPYNGRLGYI